MEQVTLAEKVMSIVVDNDLNNQVNILVSKPINDENLLNSLTEAFVSIECSLGKSELVEDVMQAILKILSGKIMLKAKEVIGHGKWSYYAMDNFDMDEHERNLRMKAANIVGIENYFYLGWKRIAALARATKRSTKRSKQADPFQDIVNNIGYMIDPQDPDDFEHFECLINAYVLRTEFSAKLQKSISFELMVDAIECGVDFNSAFIGKLEKSIKPDTSLRNYLLYETLERSPVYVPRNLKSKRRELAAIINKLSFIGNMVIQDVEGYLKRIPLESIEKCFEVVKSLLDMKHAELKGI